MRGSDPDGAPSASVCEARVVNSGRKKGVEQLEGDATGDQQDHIETVVHHIAQLRREETRRSTRLQKGFEFATRTLGAPWCAALFLVAIFSWVGGNLTSRETVGAALDNFPFPALSVCSTVAAFVFTLIILVTQKRSEELAERRSQLTLQFAVMTEQKVSKLIALLEEQRRDSAHLPNRQDKDAILMSQAADPKEVLRQMRRILDQSAPR